MNYLSISLVWVCCVSVGVMAARISPGDWSGGIPDYAYASESALQVIGDIYTLAFINYSYIDEEEVAHSEGGENGKYGEGRIMESSGIVVHIHNSDNETNHTGCSYELFDGKIPTNGDPWIALIQRGGCNFEDKVRNAHRKNAAGVLIYNDRESRTLDKMKLSDKSRNISAVFTYKDKGEELAGLVDSGIQVSLNITIGTRQYRMANNMNRTSVLFVSISFILLMIMSISWLVFYYIQRFRYIHAKDRLSKRLCSAAKKALSKIPVKNLKVEDKEIQGDGECCAVCIEPYKLSDVLRILPCRHDFHKSCIDPWLLEHRTCPMCKMDILKYYGFVFTGSQESILQLEEGENERRTTSTGPGSPNPHAAMENTSYDSERSSRASSPDELTPSLHSLPHSSNHHSTFSTDKRLQEQSPVKKCSNDKNSPSSVTGHASFYIIAEKNVKEKPDNLDLSRASQNNSNSEPTTPSKSCVCTKEPSSNSCVRHQSVKSEDGSRSPECGETDTKRILPRVHSSPSCSKNVDSPSYSNVGPSYDI